MEGYKICRTRHHTGELISATFYGKTAIYKIGEVTEREIVNEKQCGPLAVFSSIELARDFVTSTFGYRLFRVEYDPSEDKTLWFYYANDKRWDINIPTPDGTCFADRVTLIEEIMEW